MASIWRHPKSRYWTACFRDHTGRPRRISTKETSRGRALRIAEAYEKAARGKRSMRRAREIIERLNADLGGGEPFTRLSVRGFVLDWLAAKTPEVGPRTAEFYRGHLKRFLAFLGPQADEALADLSRDDLLRFRNHLLASPLSATSTNNALKILRALFRAARRDHRLADDPAEFVQGVRGPRARALKRAFSVPELQAVLSVADPEWRSLVLFGLYSGQRLGDLARLTWSNLDLQKNELRLVTAKTGKTLMIPLAAPLRRHIDSLEIADSFDAPLHPRAYATATTQGKVSTLSRQFAELLSQTGLRPRATHEAKTGPRSVGLSFHSLRRTATTLLHEAGIPPSVAQALIGHDSGAVHQTYIAVGREALDKAANAFPDLL